MMKRFIFYVFLTDKLNFDSSPIGGIYRSGLPSLEIYCNFTYDEQINGTISAKWKINGLYVNNTQVGIELNQSGGFGSSVLFFENLTQAGTSKIECEISFLAGSPKKEFLATKTGFVNIVGMYIII